MTSVEHMTDEQFERYALEVLQRELGPDGLARFLRLNRSGNRDYTRACLGLGVYNSRCDLLASGFASLSGSVASKFASGLAIFGFASCSALVAKDATSASRDPAGNEDIGCLLILGGWASAPGTRSPTNLPNH